MCDLESTAGLGITHRRLWCSLGIARQFQRIITLSLSATASRITTVSPTPIPATTTARRGITVEGITGLTGAMITAVATTIVDTITAVRPVTFLRSMKTRLGGFFFWYARF
jgi:hypothetical protein